MEDEGLKPSKTIILQCAEVKVVKEHCSVCSSHVTPKTFVLTQSWARCGCSGELELAQDNKPPGL